VDWNPEVIGAFTVGAMGAVGILQKYGILKLPIRRNGNDKASGMTIAEIAECERRRIDIGKRLDTIENTQAVNVIRLNNKKERLDKGEKRFGDLQNKLHSIDVTVAKIDTKTTQQYEFMTGTMKDMALTMQLILKKVDQ